MAYFLHRFNRELNKSVKDVAPGALAGLVEYAWPGNIRELQNYLRQWMLINAGPLLTEDQMPKIAPPASPVEDSADPFEGPKLREFIDKRLESGTDTLYAEVIAAAERKLFESVLAHTSGNLSYAARLLGINRRTLRTKLQALGIRAE